MSYIERGWAVVPLHDVVGGTCSCGSADPRHHGKQGGKHPLYEGWQNAGIRDAAAVRDFWARRPGANLGIVTGRASGIWALDVDPDNAGDRQLAGLVAAFGPLPETRIHKTGSGGAHYFWTMPDFEFTNSRGRLPLGLDVRGNASQVVAPPSFTLKGPYSVVLDVPVVEAPGWLLGMIRPAERVEVELGSGVGGAGGDVRWEGDGGGALDRGRAYANVAVRDLLGQLGAAAVGERNMVAYRVGRRLAELVNSPWSGLNVDHIWAAYMEAAARADVDGGFSQTEAHDVLAKAVRDQGGRGVGLPAADFYGTAVDWVPPTDFNQARQVPGDGGNPFTSPGQLINVPAEQVDLVFEEAVRAEMGRQIVRTTATRRITETEFVRSWREPVDHGSLTDELLLPEEELVWRIAGLLPADGNAVVVAPRKTGKTTMVGELVRSLADGEPFLGQACTPVSGGVALFNYENTARQQRAWLRTLGIQGQDRVHVLHLRGSALSLAVPAVRAWVTAWLRERSIEVWIPDPYLRAAQGVVVNENDNGQANTFTGLLDEIKAEAGVREIVMPSHSSNKNEVESGAETMRGAGRVEDWADALWYLTAVEGQRFIRATGRDVELAETQLYFDAATRRLSLGQPGRGRREVALEGDAAVVSRVLREWAEATPCTQNDLETASEFGRGRVVKAVKRLVEQNLAWVEDGPNRAKYHHHGPKPH